ncbi:hypothetical protein AgCh_011933 [Apium graveolens]
MLSHSYATDSQSKSTDLAATIIAATSPAQITDACAAVEAFLNNRTPEQNKYFFTITFPTLICKLFGFEDSSSRKPNGWIDIITNSNDSELNCKVFSFLSPNSVLISSILSADHLSQVKYVFPMERLPEWMQFMFRNEREGNSESFETVKVTSSESKRFRFENWAYSISVFAQAKRGGDKVASVESHRWGKSWGVDVFKLGMWVFALMVHGMC